MVLGPHERLACGRFWHTEFLIKTLCKSLSKWGVRNLCELMELLMNQWWKQSTNKDGIPWQCNNPCQYLQVSSHFGYMFAISTSSNILMCLGSIYLSAFMRPKIVLKCVMSWAPLIIVLILQQLTWVIWIPMWPMTGHCSNVHAKYYVTLPGIVRGGSAYSRGSI